MIYWFFLALAIMSEVIGTLSMKYATINHQITGHIIMYIMITASYILLSLAIKRVALGVAYALWEGIGIIFITLFSVVFFNESLSFTKIIGIIILVIGTMMLQSGTCRSQKNNSSYRNKCINSR